MQVLLAFYEFFVIINMFVKSEVKEMPIIKSAKKRVKVTAKKKDANVLVRSSMRTAIKNVEKAANNNASKEELNSAVDVAVKRIDKALNKGIIKKNKAARDKSRLAKLANNAE